MLWFSSRYGGFFSSRQYVSDLWTETVQMSGCFGLMCSVAPRGEQLEQLVSSVSLVCNVVPHEVQVGTNEFLTFRCRPL